jgi:[ribosomal protein S5]-alanine N-acetyltransferase
LRTITSTLCTLEPQIAAHAPEMFRVLSDPAIYEFENAPPTSEAWLQERFSRLEARQSPDGKEEWLNWVVRLPSGNLAGYVQATVIQPHVAYVAYELTSRYWRRGIGGCAVHAVLQELGSQYGVRSFFAVLKTSNFRSLALLSRLGFTPGNSDQAVTYGAGQDETLMAKAASEQPS